MHFDDKLGVLLRRLPGHVFAVLDGAHFDNLPARLRQTRLGYRPLYMDEIDVPDLDRGPHLVECNSNFAMEQVRDVTAGAPSVVWWGWHQAGPTGMRSMMGHLRRLNLIDVPEGAEDGTTPRYGRIHAPGSDEPVLFQHADPDVINSLLPVLSTQQRACFFGGAHAVLVDPPSGKAQILPNLAISAPVPSGRLRLSTAQYAELARAYGAALRRRAVLEFPKGLTAMQKHAHATRIRDAIDRAETYGCATKEQVWDFIRLDLRFGAGFEKEPSRRGVLEQLSNRDVSPGERLFRAEQELAFLERHGQL